MTDKKIQTSLLGIAGRPPALIGAGVIAALYHLRYLLSVSSAVLRQTCRPLNWRRSVRREFIRQCYFTGARALGFVFILALLVGVGMVFEVLFWLDMAGQKGYVGRLIVLLLVRQIAPILVALVVIGRSGSAIVGELGNMRISGQVRMLDAMGVDPFIFLVLPRVTAIIICTFCLTVVFLTVALGSGFTLALLAGIATVGIFDMLNVVLEAMVPLEYVSMAVKIFFPSLMIGVICCTNGLSIHGDTRGVPRMLPKTFAQCVIALFVIYVCISLVL